jgi:hypothetical protein
MSVRYHTRQNQRLPDYTCQQTRIQLAEPTCQHIPGRTIDRAIEDLVLATMTPVSMETALAVQEEIVKRQSELERLQAKQVERAQYEADLARQRYLRCDPHNRLVAGTLEADWNTALRALQQSQAEFDQQCQRNAQPITDEVRARVLTLTTDFPAVWRDPRTTDRDRKRLLRLLLEDVTLLKSAQEGTLQVRFRGGSTQTLTLPALQNAWQARTTPPEVIAEIDRLLDDHTDHQVSVILNRRGFRSGMGAPFSARIVARLRKVYELPDCFTRLRAKGFLTVGEMAAKLGVCTSTIKQWRAAGLLTAYAYSEKPEYLYELPTGDAVPTKQQGWKLSSRPHPREVMPNRSIEVQHEA